MYYTIVDALLALDEQLHSDGYDIDGTIRRALRKRILTIQNESALALTASVNTEAVGGPTLLSRLMAIDGVTAGSLRDYDDRLYWSMQPFAENAPFRRWNLYLRAKNFFSTVNTLPGTEGLRTMLVATYDSQTDLEPPVLNHDAAEGKPQGLFFYHGAPSADPTQLNNSQSVKVSPTVPAQPADTQS